MKRLLLPIILVLFLTLTLVGYCTEWLEGWDYRIELAIGDYAGDIGGSVTHFPVDVFLTATQAEEVFVELTTDAEYKKTQFTQNDGTSLLYGHMKLFDVSEELGIFAVSAAGWTINANTSVWLYYDKEHTDNDTYIGATNTSACEAVYDAKVAYPMSDGADTSSIYDATSNNHDGAKLAANNPVEVVGKISKAQDFGGDDYIDCGDSADFTFALSPFSVSLWMYIADTQGSYTSVLNKWNNDAQATKEWLFRFGTSGRFEWRIYDKDYGSLATVGVYTTDSVPTGEWVHIAGSYDGGTADAGCKIYFNGVLKDTTGHDISDNFVTMGDTVAKFFLGAMEGATPGSFFTGKLDEIRLAAVERSVNWFLGEYNSGNDDLFTYGSEEGSLIGVSTLWFGTNL